MALTVKPIEAASVKWTDNAGRAATEFGVNAAAAADLWARNTGAARDNYGQAVTAAGIKDRFARGVAKAGAAKFARKIMDVGQSRFGPGVAAATADYKAGAEPYYATLAALNLPARKPRGDPGNLARVDVGNRALHAKRLAILGSGG